MSMHGCVRACVHACVCVCVCACMRVCICNLMSQDWFISPLLPSERGKCHLVTVAGVSMDRLTGPR